MIKPELQKFVSDMSLEGLAIPKVLPIQGGNAVGTQDFSIEDLVDCWRIKDVSYKNGIYQADVSKTLLPQGTQAEHAQRRKEALTTGSFYAPDYPLFHGVINALYQNREESFKEQIEAARTFLLDFVSYIRLMTLTRIIYAPNGQDLVIHNYGQVDKYEVPSNFVGPDGDITNPETNAGAALQALLGTQQSPQEINQVYRWFSDTDFYLMRINTRPQEITEEIAVFIADAIWGYLVCDRDPQTSQFSLGVRAEKIK
jgi:hypothetical protein